MCLLKFRMLISFILKIEFALFHTFLSFYQFIDRNQSSCYLLINLSTSRVRTQSASLNTRTCVSMETEVVLWVREFLLLFNFPYNFQRSDLFDKKDYSITQVFCREYNVLLLYALVWKRQIRGRSREVFVRVSYKSPYDVT
jgi:hypothetical protein